MNQQIPQQIKIKILNVVQNYIQNHDWINYDDFADDFADEIIKQFEKSNFDLDKILDKTKGSFLQLNEIKKPQFLNDVFVNNLIKSWNKINQYSVPVCRFTDIFPHMVKISDEDIKPLQEKLKIEESVIQTALRDALRENNATSIAQRGKDSPLEVADLEHFEMSISGRDYGFTVVVKGYNSLSGKVRWKDIAHQVTKAYRTHPDYILVISAREPVDDVISEMKLYSQDVGNSNLVIFIPPLDVLKFLHWRKII